MHLQYRHIYLSKRYDDSWQEQKIELAKAFKEMYHQKIHYFLYYLAQKSCNQSHLEGGGGVWERDFFCTQHSTTF